MARPRQALQVWSLATWLLASPTPHEHKGVLLQCTFPAHGGNPLDAGSRQAFPVVSDRQGTGEGEHLRASFQIAAALQQCGGGQHHCGHGVWQRGSHRHIAQQAAGCCSCVPLHLWAAAGQGVVQSLRPRGD